MLSVLSIVSLLLLSSETVSSQSSSACPSYNASKIKLVTFDCFAALMAWEDSMFASVAEVLPYLSTNDVHTLVTKWENAYGAATNSVFEEGVTGAFPFSWHISNSLKDIIRDMGLDISRDEFDALVKCWGKLTPWENTQETLEILADANYTIGALSNGDYYTLATAVSIFHTPVEFSHIFSSDFPAGVFKPQPAIYEPTKHIGFEVEEILHVAGGGNDASGARDAGLFSALLHKPPKDGKTEPCFVLNDITELPAVLGL
mmetsp:Transcript_22981/g.33594  ORF Transcript_22981/g.33594 Transcript_22981/m.33594 type:complete len:259 (+) Transcript_22981:108-884(+)